MDVVHRDVQDLFKNLLSFHNIKFSLTVSRAMHGRWRPAV